MRYWTLPSLLLACFLLLPSIALAWPGKVVEVTDRDTLVVMKGNKEVDVRLYGIDTPESDQPYGMMAARFTKMMARFGEWWSSLRTWTNTAGRGSSPSRRGRRMS